MLRFPSSGWQVSIRPPKIPKTGRSRQISSRSSRSSRGWSIESIEIDVKHWKGIMPTFQHLENRWPLSCMLRFWSIYIYLWYFTTGASAPDLETDERLEFRHMADLQMWKHMGTGDHLILISEPYPDCQLTLDQPNLHPIPSGISCMCRCRWSILVGVYQVGCRPIESTVHCIWGRRSSKSYWILILETFKQNRAETRHLKPLQLLQNNWTLSTQSVT